MEDGLIRPPGRMVVDGWLVLNWLVTLVLSPRQ
jgi:hypothetical protein